MLIIKRVILGRNEGKRKYVSRTGLSCKCRVANGSRGRKQGGISRTKRGRSRWKQGEEAGLSKIYKERGINEIYKGREKLILVGEEYVRFNVTHTHTHTHSTHPCATRKENGLVATRRWRSNLFICMTLRNANTLAFRECGCPRWYPSGYVKFFEPPSATCTRDMRPICSLVSRMGKIRGNFWG